MQSYSYLPWSKPQCLLLSRHAYSWVLKVDRMALLSKPSSYCCLSCAFLVTLLGSRGLQLCLLHQVVFCSGTATPTPDQAIQFSIPIESLSWLTEVHRMKVHLDLLWPIDFNQMWPQFFTFFPLPMFLCHWSACFLLGGVESWRSPLSKIIFVR